MKTKKWISLALAAVLTLGLAVAALADTATLTDLEAPLQETVEYLYEVDKELAVVRSVEVTWESVVFDFTPTETLAWDPVEKSWTVDGVSATSADYVPVAEQSITYSFVNNGCVPEGIRIVFEAEEGLAIGAELDTEELILESLAVYESAAERKEGDGTTYFDVNAGAENEGSVILSLFAEGNLPAAAENTTCGVVTFTLVLEKATVNDIARPSASAAPGRP